MTPRPTAPPGALARQAAGSVCALLLAIGLLWAVGFALFDQASRRRAPPPPAADGIVVLTGGVDRIETGLRLLDQGVAPLLLISGVGGGVPLAELTRSVRLPTPLAGQVTLGRVATTTSGNAAETAIWARAHAVRRLIVVTAGYHMPRALLEIGRALPDVTLYPVPVRPPALRGPLEFATVRMLATEYDKYLAVRLRLPRRPEADPA